MAVLTAAFLFNLGQGVLRPSMPLYLQSTFGANYRMVTLIPVVFGAGKTNALLTAIQTGGLVFLFPLYLLTRGGLGPKAVGTVVGLGVLGRLLAFF